MKLGILIIAAMLLCSVTATSGAINSVELEKQIAECEGKNYKCIGQLEAVALANSGGAVKHNGGTLAIKTKAKLVALKDVANKDLPIAEVEAVVHAYLGMLDGVNYHLIREDWWEGFSYVLISDISGEKFSMQDIPHLSPTHKKLVAVTSGEALGSKQEIVVWRITPERLVQEFRDSPDSNLGMYSFFRWRDDNKIELERRWGGETNLCGKNQAPTIHQLLLYSQNKWKLGGELPETARCTR